MPVVLTSGTVPVVPIVPSTPPAGWVPDKVAADPVVVPNVHYVFLIAPVQQSEEDIDLGGGHEPSVPITTVPNVAPSLNVLKQELQVSTSASSSVKYRIQEDENWKDQVFSTLRVHEFVSIIRVITIEFDQAEVAAMIAPVINDLTFQYIVTVIRSISEWM